MTSKELRIPKGQLRNQTIVNCYVPNVNNYVPIVNFYSSSLLVLWEVWVPYLSFWTFEWIYLSFSLISIWTTNFVNYHLVLDDTPIFHFKHLQVNRYWECFLLSQGYLFFFISIPRVSLPVYQMRLMSRWSKIS